MSVAALSGPEPRFGPDARLSRAVEALETALVDLAGVDLSEVSSGSLGEVCERLQRASRQLGGSRAAVADRFAQDGSWWADGAKSAVTWLRWKGGDGYGPAASLVEAGEMTRHLPEVGQAWRDGHLGEGHVRALRRAWQRFPRLHPHLVAAQDKIIELAAEQEPKRFWGCLQRLCRQLDPEAYDAGAKEPEFSLHASTVLDGHVRVDGLLPADVGAQFIAMLEAARRQLQPDGTTTPELDVRRTSSRNVEALQRILTAAESQGEFPTVAGARPIVHVTVEAEVLATGAGMGWLERFGVPETPVSAEFARRLACDATLRPLILDADGNLAAFGTASRVIPSSMRRYVVTRDRHCRFGGCQSRIDEVHHVVFYSRGGPTRSDNLLGLCWHHHHLVHEGGWKVRGNANDAVECTSPKGKSWISRVPKPQARLLPLVL